jgi:GNAT superfamily N-acetyltransferase
MPFLLVDPDDVDLIDQAVGILNRSRTVDDPDGFPVHPTLLARSLRYGWDLEPDETYLYSPADGQPPAGVLALSFPSRDNLHLGWADITVDPVQRRRGAGSAILEEVIRRTRNVGRTTIWLGTAEDDLGAKAFLESFGFRYASHDARRRQVLSEVDTDAVARLYAVAEAAAHDYVLERGTLPTPADVLEELVDVTAAINDAPMGDLTFTEELFDLKRLQDIEAAAAGRQDEVYRIWARHRGSGAVGGHTLVATNRLQPGLGRQGDTAVSRHHRGHRLGLLLKIAMMRWLAEVEPQLEVIETWNQADNDYMIRVNEAIGYRLNRVFAMYELTL